MINRITQGNKIVTYFLCFFLNINKTILFFVIDMLIHNNDLKQVTIYPVDVEYKI